MEMAPWVSPEPGCHPRMLVGRVNTPPPKGGGFILRLKSAIPAEAGLSPADAGSSKRGRLLVYPKNIHIFNTTQLPDHIPHPIRHPPIRTLLQYFVIHTK